MFRPRLRSRTGCTRCRARRVKCDESRPVCENCQRRGLLCIWQANETNARGNTASLTVVTSDNQNRTAIVTRFPTTRIQNISSYEPFENELQFRLTLAILPHLQPYFQSKKLPVFHDFSFLSTLVIQEAWLRDVVAACSAAITAETFEFAHMFYARACRSLRQRLNTRQNPFQPPEFDLLMGSVFLALFESILADHPRPSLIHHSATTRILCQMSRVWQPTELNPLLLFTVELNLLSISSIPLLDSGLDHVLKSVDTDDMRRIINQTLTTSLQGSSQQIPGAHINFTLSLEILMQMFEIVQFSRQRHSLEARQNKADMWLRTLDQLESATVQVRTSLPLPAICTAHSIRMVHLHCCRIAVTKIQNHRSRTGDLFVQQQVAAAASFISDIDFIGDDGPHVITACYILLCATDDEDLYDHLESLLVSLKPPFVTPGLLVWIMKTVARIRMYRSQEENGCFQDGLDLLLHPAGILGYP